MTAVWVVRRISWVWTGALFALMVWVCVGILADRPLPVDLLAGLIAVGLFGEVTITNLIDATDPDVPRSTPVQWVTTVFADILTLVWGTTGLTFAYLLMNPEMATHTTKVGLLVVAVSFFLARMAFGITARRLGLWTPEPGDQDTDAEHYAGRSRP